MTDDDRPFKAMSDEGLRTLLTLTHDRLNKARDEVNANKLLIDSIDAELDRQFLGRCS